VERESRTEGFGVERLLTFRPAGGFVADSHRPGIEFRRGGPANVRCIKVDLDSRACRNGISPKDDPASSVRLVKRDLTVALNKCLDRALLEHHLLSGRHHDSDVLCVLAGDGELPFHGDNVWLVRLIIILPAECPCEVPLDINGLSCDQTTAQPNQQEQHTQCESRRQCLLALPLVHLTMFTCP
jgi:hypothetical protein